MTNKPVKISHLSVSLPILLCVYFLLLWLYPSPPYRAEHYRPSCVPQFLPNLSIFSADITQLELQMPNLPIVFWHQNKNNNMRMNSSCAKFPSILDIQLENHYWQKVETRKATFHLYGAYLDTREANQLGPTVRILGVIDLRTPFHTLEQTLQTHCQLWFPDSQAPVFSKVGCRNL